MTEVTPSGKARLGGSSLASAQARVVASATRAPRGLLAVVRPPTWPGTVHRPAPKRNVGVDYDTTWSRGRTARLVRAVIVDSLTRPFVNVVASPSVIGVENLDPIEGPVIFAANHSSHLDTAVVLGSLPSRFRHRAVVAAAADYFFDRRWKGDLWSLTLGAIPVERTRVNRRSLDLAASLIEDGWSLVIFPEGGRTADGWGQEFHPGGAAYLAKRCGVPVVPVHLYGVRPVFPKGGDRLRPGKVEVRFGRALRPLGGGADQPNEDARHLSARIEDAVAVLADEAASDWWSAKRRAAAGQTPELRGPDASPWRRAWELPESQRSRGSSPARTRSDRRAW